jgi:DNA-binding winged helix-turn-helix (wHTH) protein
MTTQTADLKPTSSTVRRVLTTVGIEAGIVGTVPGCGYKWIRAGVDPYEAAKATDALMAAFPDRIVIGFRSEVRVRVTP